MSATPTCNWTGASGEQYTYHIFELPTTFDAHQLGNYIYAKLNAQNKWAPIYIGQGDLNDRANRHHKSDCLKRKGATHFHCHKTASERNRLAEEGDLLACYTQAYAPTGCNERKGG